MKAMAIIEMSVIIILFLLITFAVAKDAKAGFSDPMTLPSLNGVTIPLGGNLLLLGSCISTDTTVLGAKVGMAVSVSPQTNPGAGALWLGFVSAADTVTTKVCALIALTPANMVYNIRVVQ